MRRMYDPGGNSEDEINGDWSFLGEEVQWRAVQIGEEKRERRSEGIEGVGVKEWDEEEAEEEERKEHKKDVKGKED